MSTDIIILLSIFLVSFIPTANLAKILAVFPTPSISHQVVFRSLTLELVKRGHEVTVITTDPAFKKGEAPSNLTEIDLHDLSYQLWTDNLLKEEASRKNDIYTQIETILKLTTKIFETQLATKEVQQIIQKKHGQFDLLLLEAYSNPVLIFTHLYQLPTIQISSFAGVKQNYEVFGVSTHPFLYPGMFHKRVYNLSIIEKLEQLYNYWRMNRIFDIAEQDDGMILRKTFGENIPTIRELSKNIDMIFLNTHPMWMNNLPLPASVVHISGIHKNSPKILPKDLDLFLNASKNGVIYFSLGTNVIVSLLPPEKIQMMIKVFSQLPYDVIWKWDQDTMPGKSDNIKLYKWLPQSDLLKHPKIKLFITQCGLQSTDEAIDAGVPMIGIPILADQWYNGDKYQQLEIGIKLDLISLTEEEFKGAIERIIFDKRYRENIKRLGKIVKDEPQTPLERAVWWTEYVLRYGGAKHLKAAGANMSWAQYLELELVAIVITVLFSLVLLVLATLYFIWRSISHMRPFFKMKKL